MILKKLTIHNIASIEDAELDFEAAPLSGASMFLICGETGAGKSTVLDAVCLALYGETPRMSSVGKEELELTDESIKDYERYYSNDNSQLLRRGAGEGFSSLVFTASDGKDYEAVWEVHRAHYKPGKRLLRPSRKLQALDGSYGESRHTEIKQKITELIGLQYDQFCRTVMLAQGEFTKFLKSSRVEKSDILEKLTGTGIYSELGRRIARKYSECLALLEAKAKEAASIIVMDEEQTTEFKNELATCKADIDAAGKERAGLEVKLKWMETFEKLTSQSIQLQKELREISEAKSSEEYQRELKTVSDYDRTAEARGLIAKINKCNESLKKKNKELPVLVKKSESAAAKAESKGKELKAKEEELNAVQSQLAAIDIDGIAAQLHDLTGRDKILSELVTACEKVKGEGKALQIISANLEKANLKINDCRNKIVQGVEPLKTAEEELSRWTEALAKTEISLSEAVKEIRSQLRIGDNCPVCGRTIDSPVDAGAMAGALIPLQEGKRKAEKRFLKLRADSDTLDKLMGEYSRQRAALAKDMKEAEESSAKAAGEFEKLLADAGFEGQGQDVCEAAATEKKSMEVKREALRARQKEGERLSKSASAIIKEMSLLRNAFDKASRAAQDSIIVQSRAEAEIGALAGQIAELEKELDIQMALLPDMTESRLLEVSSLDKTAVDGMKTRVKELEEGCNTVNMKLELTKEQLQKHKREKPRIDESESISGLKSVMEELSASVKVKSEKMGRIAEILESERVKKCQRMEKESEVETASQSLDRWTGLYKRFGDQKGSKLRSIAQSFILKALLENANRYMGCFTERYTLTCNPGTLAILVRDSYKTSEPQPVSILSGGESFMASLSLALALSNLRGHGNESDILFIDEGFGTLSGNCLNNVMDTLERLHQIGGRRVGLISHVADLKERIPVHVEVSRVNPALSRIAVTG